MRRVARNVALPVRVRVSVRAPLEAQPIQERFRVGTRNDVLHDEAHLEFNAQRVQKRDYVRVVPNPIAPEASRFVCVRGGGLQTRVVRLLATSQSNSFVETVDVERCLLYTSPSPRDRG